MRLSAWSARRRAARLAPVLLSVAVASASGPADDSCADSARAAESAPARSGRLLVLPGVGNTRFHLAGFARRAARQLPGFEVDVRTWGTPLLTSHNLRAHERNVATARQFAAEIAEWRRAHPSNLFYLIGYSGGGGMAVLIASALPEDVSVDRLVLVAPAISPDYPVESEVLPHVQEFVVNYASERDLQVGWGTKTFGTIDRKQTASAGAVGFDFTGPKVLQYYWSDDDRRYGHQGNHLSYLGRRWQNAKLLPAIDPALTAEQLRAEWVRTCEKR